jgi:hypothetical protein
MLPQNFDESTRFSTKKRNRTFSRIFVARISTETLCSWFSCCSPICSLIWLNSQFSALYTHKKCGLYRKLRVRKVWNSQVINNPNWFENCAHAGSLPKMTKSYWWTVSGYFLAGYFVESALRLVFCYICLKIVRGTIFCWIFEVIFARIYLD